MDEVIRHGVTVAEPRRALATKPVYQAYQLLHWGFVVAATVAGLDKFFDRLTNWGMYLAPAIKQMLPISTQAFMYLIGGVELAAGLLVALKPRIGAWVIAGWLGAIIVNLFLRGDFFDVALRDIGLCIAALALARLSVVYDRGRRSLHA